MGQERWRQGFLFIIKSRLTNATAVSAYTVELDLCLNCMFLQKHVTDTIKKGEFAEPFQHLIHSPILIFRYRGLQRSIAKAALLPDIFAEPIPRTQYL